MASKKKMQTDASSVTVSWLSHPTRLFGQPEKRKENNKCVIPIDGLKQNDYFNKQSSETSTGQHNIEDVVTNNGYHKMFKDEKYVTTGGGKSKNVTSIKMDKSHEYIPPPKSNGSRNKDKKDQNDDIKVIKTKNDEVMECLDIIQNVATKLKNGDDVFCNTIMKIQDLDKIRDSKVKARKYNLVNNLLSVLLDPTDDDLKFIEETLKAMIIPDPIKRFVVDTNCLMPYDFIGEGYSSVVFEALLSKDGQRTRVAFKKPRSKVFDNLMIREATTLSQLDHKNIIQLLAFDKTGPVIALELMELGNLYQALTSVWFSDRELLTVLTDISKGMEYLHGKKYLHRDLACRNVFVNANKECKIGDFGLSVYVGDSNGVFRDPGLGVCVKNVSPDEIFSFQTDVWSMGLLVLELYQDGISKGGSQYCFPVLAAHLMREEIQLKKPRRCPDRLFQFTMNYLLNMNFKDRPDFSTIRETIEGYLKK